MQVNAPSPRARCRATRPAAVLAAVALICLGLQGAFVATTPARAGAASSSGIPIMGPSTLTPVQIARWYAATGRTAAVPVSVEQLAGLFVLEGAVENVRGDIAFAQSIVETGYFGFVGSIVHPENYNYAGMGACDTCGGGRQFPNPQTGIRAQIQHLKNYADITSRAATLFFPPVLEWYAPTSHDPVVAARNFDTFFLKGRAPTWNQMGNGNWATSTAYASTVLGVYNRMLTYNGLAGICPPDGLGVGTHLATQCPPTLQSPGRAVAAAGTGHYLLSGTGAVKSVNAPYFGAPTFGWDIARDIAVMPDGQGYIVLDGWGGLHKFGSAATGVIGGLGFPYWPGWDIARSITIMPDGKGYIVLDGWGGLHPTGSAPAFAHGPYWRGWDIARSVRVKPDGAGAYVLDGFGMVWPLGTARHIGHPWFGWDIARQLTVTPDGNGYAVLDGFGGIHAFGSAPLLANPLYAAADRFRGIAATSTGHYFLVRNDGADSTV